MPFICLFLLTVAATTTAISLPYHSETVIGQFKEFVKKHDKNYENEIEEAFRFGIFLKNLDFIDHLNKHNNGAKFGITKFADKTGEEIKKWNTGSIKQDYKNHCTIISAVGDINETFSRFDWRTKGVVTPVKDQGQCGSSWAFSTVGNLESVRAIKWGNLVNLSAQQLVDCDTAGYGCNGGYLTSAFAYLKENGSMYESSYPYVGHSQSCRYDSIKATVHMNDCYTLEKANEDMYPRYLRQWGPLSILLDSTILPNYLGGLIRYDDCLSVDVDHGALIVGYDKVDIYEFWIVKNSWGQDWGEQGYFRVIKGENCLALANYPPVSAYIV